MDVPHNMSGLLAIKVVLTPLSDRRFPGYTDKLDAAVHKKYIYGKHVAEYMAELQEEDDEKFKEQFSRPIML
jgi:large subunit ribosomal protein L5e